MASPVHPSVPMGSEALAGAALQHSPWRITARLASGLEKIEQFLEAAGFDRAPWLVAAYGGGIAFWFAAANVWTWGLFIALSLTASLAALGLMGEGGRYPYLRQSIMVVALMAAAGCAMVWTKSELAGAPAISRPQVALSDGRVLKREEQPAEHRVRLHLATRDPETGRAIRVRLNLDADGDVAGLAEGARVRLRARLVPPAPPMLPGGYDFARAAWFSGIAATGSVLGKPAVLDAANNEGPIARTQRALSQHVRANLGGSPGAIAAAFASGDRGAIAQADEDAMRDAGLTHLLSISGLHVSAVIAAAYFLALRFFALIPWLALRVRLPLLAAASGASAGIAYTLLTGAEVPTIRSCLGAVLVLAALTLGREPLSLRMIAVVAFLLLVFWPEALAGPSFQMSFASVLAIVAFHGSAPVRAFLAPREEPLWSHVLRQGSILLATGLVIELALMPIGLYHFHRAGVYGAVANVIAIPLTTFVSMPLIALALLFDLAGMGAPFWWLAGKSLELLLALAHWTAGIPGAVTLLPAMGRGAFALFVAGGLWLALWRGKVRLWGLAPAALGLILLLTLRTPDLLISGDGRHVGITGEGEQLLVLRAGRSDYTRQNLAEVAGMSGDAMLLSDWPGARCNEDFCALALKRGARNWQLLIGKSSDMVPERELAAACERVDLVISDRYVPRSCRPRWLKVDRRLLDRTGGMTIDLANGKVRTVAEDEGQHGWWQPVVPPWQRGDKAGDGGKGGGDAKDAGAMESDLGSQKQEGTAAPTAAPSLK